MSSEGHDVPVDNDNQPTHKEMVGRVIYSLLGPALDLARAFSIPLSDVSHWLELAYFRKLRASNMTLGDIAERLGVSARKAAELSRMLKENFFDPERKQGMARQIEFMVWAEPLSLARIKQTLDAGAEEVERAVETLIAAGRIVEREGRTPVYEIARGESRLVEDGWLSKVDALNHLLSTISSAVYARFFASDGKALARNLHFHIRAEDLPELRALYEDHIWPTLSEMDERAANDRHRIPMDLSVAWAPHQYIDDTIDDE
ncbi:MAG: hypothetical protein ACQEVA_00430 [Myxococcota bacterium]